MDLSSCLAFRALIETKCIIRASLTSVASGSDFIIALQVAIPGKTTQTVANTFTVKANQITSFKCQAMFTDIACVVVLEVFYCINGLLIHSMSI